MVSGLYLMTMNFHTSLSQYSGVGPKSTHRAIQPRARIILSPHLLAHLSSYPPSSQMKTSSKLTWKRKLLSLLPNDPNDLWFKVIIPLILQVPNLVRHTTPFHGALFCILRKIILSLDTADVA